MREGGRRRLSSKGERACDADHVLYKVYVLLRWRDTILMRFMTLQVAISF